MQKRKNNFIKPEMHTSFFSFHATTQEFDLKRSLYI